MGEVIPWQLEKLKILVAATGTGSNVVPVAHCTSCTLVKSETQGAERIANWWQVRSCDQNTMASM